MAIESSKTEPHWNYFLALEADFVQLSRYVEFRPENYECFSIEIAHLLLATASEVDVLCKQLCKLVDPGSTADNIHAYRDEICPAYPQIPTFAVLLPRFSLTLHPWDEWRESDGVPFWWTSYNKVKHERDRYFSRASLKNALNSLAGLFVLVLYRLKDRAALGELFPSPQLLYVEAEYQRGMSIGGRGIGVRFKL